MVDADLITHITPSGGNVFANLGFDKEESNKLKLKAQLMCSLSEWIKDNKFKQEEAAILFGVSRPRVSDVAWLNSVILPLML